MPQINTSNIQTTIDQQLARLYNFVEYSPDNLLAYALSGSNLNNINVITVADSDSLPYLYYGGTVLPSGMVYFVQSIGILVISSTNKWIALDGVVVRTDLQTNNMAWVWGANCCGQTGDNTTVSKSSPVSVVGGFTDWCQISTASYSNTGHTFAIRTNGTLWAWGHNDSGRLGDNTSTGKSSPVSVVGGFTDWCQVEAGMRGGLAVRTNGTAWAWGYNGQGSLGDNTTTTRSSPVSVVGGFTDWCQLSGSKSVSNGNFSLGVRQNGTAWAWGQGSYGRLGDGSCTNRSSPVLVSQGFTDWCQVSAGENISLGVRQNGTAWGWGRNTYGNIGNGSTTATANPNQVQGGITDWCQVAAGARHSLGVRQNGTAWAWGRQYSGEFGNGTNISNLSPVSVVGGFADWRQVSAGYSFSIGIRASGGGWAWGSNCQGKLGDGTTTNRCSPVSIAGNFRNWWQVSVSRCAAAGITLE